MISRRRYFLRSFVLGRLLSARPIGWCRPHFTAADKCVLRRPDLHSRSWGVLSTSLGCLLNRNRPIWQLCGMEGICLLLASWALIPESDVDLVAKRRKAMVTAMHPPPRQSADTGPLCFVFEELNLKGEDKRYKGRVSCVIRSGEVGGRVSSTCTRGAVLPSGTAHGQP